MIFKKRTEAPSSSNKYYLKAGKGGYNRAMEINTKTHSCIPNCCGLVHGRWLESQEQTKYSIYDKLCIGDAHSYYKHKDDYKRGQTPKLGAIICFEKKGGSGHVAFVEEIKSNGDILTSNSAYKGRRFFTKTLKKSKKYKYGLNYTLQGFIYSPVEFEKQYNLERKLKLKCKGKDVEELQKELKIRGYDLGKYGKNKNGIDGVFGNTTKEAVIKFQKINKLKVDGVVGKETAHALDWLFKGK